MLRGFKAKKCLFFTVDGKPRSGGSFCYTGAYDSLPFGERRNDYWKIVKHIAKQAVLEQGWQLTNEAIYMCVYMYLPPLSLLRKRSEREACLKNERFAVRKPQLLTYLHKLQLTLSGIVFEKDIQIVALQVFKEYDSEPRTEVFIGVPSDWEGIENDLSRAE